MTVTCQIRSMVSDCKRKNVSTVLKSVIELILC